MAPWRVALVGGGRMGQNYLETYLGFPDVDIVAVVDPNSDRAAAVCSRHSIPHHFPSLEAMLGSTMDKPDCVSIVTPGKYFRELVLAAAAAGIAAVQCEKPLVTPPSPLPAEPPCLPAADRALSTWEAAAWPAAG